MDDILTFILLSIGVSASDFKSDSFKWFSKAVRLAYRLGLNKEMEEDADRSSSRTRPYDFGPNEDLCYPPMKMIEAKEERRRIFWLLYSLDRHLALSFNTALAIPDSTCQVFGTYYRLI